MKSTPLPLIVFATIAVGFLVDLFLKALINLSQSGDVECARSALGAIANMAEDYGTHQLNTEIAPELLVRECRQASTMCVQTQVWLADGL